MSMIGKMNTRISIQKRREVGDFSNADEWGELTGGSVEYELVLDTWAKVIHQSTAKKFNNRAVGNNTGGTIFEIRNPMFELEKDHYIDAKGYRYKIEGTMPIDDRHRFLQVDTIFIGKCNEEA